MNRFVVPLLFLLASSIVLAQTPVPVREEPHHHLKFENNFVRVFDVVVPPGDSTLFHIHEKDYTFVTLGEAVLKTQLLGKEEQDLNVKNGAVGFTRATITHRVRNVGTSLFHNLTVEILRSADGANSRPLNPLGKNQTVLMENDWIRVIRLVLKPGESTGMHSHSRPGLGMPITEGLILVDSPGKDSEKRQLTPGWFAWRESAVIHSITNVGQKDYESLDIEIK